MSDNPSFGEFTKVFGDFGGGCRTTEKTGFQAFGEIDENSLLLHVDILTSAVYC